MSCPVFHAVDLGLFYKTRWSSRAAGGAADVPNRTPRVGPVVQKLTFEVIKRRKGAVCEKQRATFITPIWPVHHCLTYLPMLPLLKPVRSHICVPVQLQCVQHHNRLTPPVLLLTLFFKLFFCWVSSRFLV